MRIHLNEVSDYEYVQRKLREQAVVLLEKAKSYHQPVSYLPRRISGHKVNWWSELKKYGRLVGNRQ